MTSTTTTIGWMDGWMYYTGLARQSTDRKALYEAGGTIDQALN
jgi:hypothetical protein